MKTAALAALAWLAAACDGPQTHILAAQAYEASRDCLDPMASLEVVAGPHPGLGCAPVCLATPAGQNGSASGIYVTTECGPYPPLDDTSGGELGCAGALAAFARGDFCMSDGTSTNPEDAGAEAASGD